MSRWQSLKESASVAIIKNGGTISHQHGVGRDHKKWLQQEKGLFGMGLIKSMLKQADPNETFNRGALVD